MKRISILAVLLVALPLIVLSGLRTGDWINKHRTTGESIAIPTPHLECQIDHVHIGAQEKYNHTTERWVYVQVFYARDKQIVPIECPGLPTPSWTITGNESAGFEVDDPSFPWSGYFSGQPGIYELTVVVGDKHDSKTLTVKGHRK